MPTKVALHGGSRKREPIRWSVLRIEYITTLDLSLRELARRHSLDSSNIQSRASREGWEADRRKYVELLITETRQLAVKELSTLAAKRLLAVMDSTREVRRLAVQNIKYQLSPGAKRRSVKTTIRTVQSTPEVSVTKDVSSHVEGFHLPPRDFAAMMAVEMNLLLQLFFEGNCSACRAKKLASFPDYRNSS